MSSHFVPNRPSAVISSLRSVIESQRQSLMFSAAEPPCCGRRPARHAADAPHRYIVDWAERIFLQFLWYIVDTLIYLEHLRNGEDCLLLHTSHYLCGGCGSQRVRPPRHRTGRPGLASPGTCLLNLSFLPPRKTDHCGHKRPNDWREGEREREREKRERERGKRE
jgi:hypothetical protein